MASSAPVEEHTPGWGDASALQLEQLQKGVSIGYVMLLASAALLLLVADPELLRFAPITTAQLMSILMPLLVISLFLERAVEVLVNAWRQGGRDRLELALEAQRDQGEPTTALRHELSAYRDGTRCAALLTSMVAGVLLAALGLRSLELLVDADMLAAFPAWQQTSLAAIDIVITGALLAGGADGIHKIISTFTTFLDVSSKRLRARD